MPKVTVSLDGCDDSTEFDIEVDYTNGLPLLEELERLSKETATYGCMPIFTIVKKEE